MSFTDLDTLHKPTPRGKPPSTWGGAINDNFNFFNDGIAMGAWTGWTPAVTQSGSVSSTVDYANYARVGRIIIAQCKLSVTASGTSSTKVNVSLPVTAAQAGGIVVGEFRLFDSGATNYVGAAFLDSTTTCAGLIDQTGNPLGVSGFTAALASGDIIYVSMIYEAAS